jgi:hypothetical protein
VSGIDPCGAEKQSFNQPLHIGGQSELGQLMRKTGFRCGKATVIAEKNASSNQRQ